MLTISFNPEILSLFGPLSIHIYGVLVALGIASFITLSFNHPLRIKNITAVLYEKLIIYTILVALLGARVLHVLSEWNGYNTLEQMVSVWNGGLSILGAVLAGLVFVPLNLRYNKVPVLPILDLGALFLPLAQAIARLGCLFSGCCFGAVTTSACSIMYTHPGAHAPLHVALHPTQLYSSLIFFGIFILLQLLARNFKLHPGTLTGLYLILSSLERFTVDFFRGDRIINSADALISTSYFSMHQWISLSIIIVGIALLIANNNVHKKAPSH